MYHAISSSPFPRSGGTGPKGRRGPRTPGTAYDWPCGRAKSAPGTPRISCRAAGCQSLRGSWSCTCKHVRSDPKRSQQARSKHVQLIPINSTQLNSTQLNSTQLNSTQLSSAQLNSTQLNPMLNSTQLKQARFKHISFERCSAPQQSWARRRVVWLSLPRPRRSSTTRRPTPI